MNNLYLYNTVSRKKETFVPLDKNNVRMYVCGPTVYDYPHVGNARPLIIFDVLFRLLQELYGTNKVTYARNITDVDDKIIEAAKENKTSIFELTKKVTINFHEDCKYLGCLIPTIEPKATDHIPEMISLTEKLIANNFAYEKNNHVFFEVAKFSSYGKLSNKKLVDLIVGARVEVSDLKKSPADFVLWKPSINNEPGWDSPWGKGRPGWHLECSAMSEKYLGKEFDIHGGGLDLIFPHHENEIAQSICANQTRVLANVWMHNGYVTVNKEKMSKSLNNFITINQLKEKHDGQVIRLAMLSANYKQPFDWNDKILEDSYKILNKWYEFYSSETLPINPSILQHLKDDLNTPKFIAEMHKLYDQAIEGDKDSASQLSSACKLLGLFNKNNNDWKKNKNINYLSESEIQLLISKRNLAREQKDFKRSDEIRKMLNEGGVVIEDNQNVTTWKYK